MQTIVRALLVLVFAAPVLCLGQTPEPGPCNVSQAELDANKQLLLDFFTHPGPRAVRAEMFLADDYIQHNPRLRRIDEITGASGRESWLQGFLEAERRGIRLVDLNGIQLRNPIIIMAECDLVTAIYRGIVDDPDNPGRTYEAFAFETVRVRDGKLAEHWDQVTLDSGWMQPVEAAD